MSQKKYYSILLPQIGVLPKKKGFSKEINKKKDKSGRVVNLFSIIADNVFMIKL
ncbi:MAG: hypothetical protein ABI288_10095 [Ginsengibacter sp.]